MSGNGGVLGCGDATPLGGATNLRLAAPIAGIASTPDSKGYWLVGTDGGVFAFGDAEFDGSMGGKMLNASIVGIAATRTARVTGSQGPTVACSASVMPRSSVQWAAKG